MNSPIKVAITGARQIGLCARFSGSRRAKMFGPEQPVMLHLIEIPP